MNDDLQKTAEAYFDEHLAKVFGNVPSERVKWKTSRSHDYSKSVLSSYHQKNDYEVHVHRGPHPAWPEHEHMESTLYHRGRQVGSVRGAVWGHNKNKKLSITDTSLDKEHHAKGLGKAMYEALYHHAAKTGITHVEGGSHTESAARVHESLSEKHGMNYSPTSSHSGYDYKLPMKKTASVGHGMASTAGPGLVGSGAMGALKPAMKNEDLEPSKHRDTKTLTTINKLFGKEAPRDIVAIAVMHGEKLLMGKRKDCGKYNCPGGHVDDGEKYEEAALRELKEETGIEGHPLKYMGSFPDLDKNLVIHTYRCSVYEDIKTNAKADPDEEVDAWEWFDLEEGLPKKVTDNLYNKNDVVLKILGLQAMYKSELYGSLKKGARGDWKNEGYKLNIELSGSDPVISAVHPNGTNEVGRLNVTDKGEHIKATSVRVDSKHQRKGIATAMYRLAEQHTGKKFKPSDAQFSDAKDLWSQPNRPFGKSELDKHDYSHRPDKQPSPLHGWISPSGEYHQMKPNEGHGEWISNKLDVRDHEGAQQRAHSEGWLSVGRGGNSNAEGQALESPRHPATLKLRQLISDHHPMHESFEVSLPHKPVERQIHNIEPEKFVRHGRMVDFQTEQPINKSDLKKGAQGDWKQEGYTIHPFSDHKEGRKFVETHQSSLISVFPANVAGNHSAYAMKDGKIVGNVQLSDTDRGLVPIETKVHDDHQRKGLASAMLSAMEHHTGKKVTRSDNESPEGKALFSNPNRPFGKSESDKSEDIAKGWHDEDDIEHKELDAKDIVTHQRSADKARSNISQGRSSQTKGPIDVWRLEDGRHLLVDGQHRFAAGIDAGKRKFNVRVVGSGYSDFYATPDDKNKYRITKVDEENTSSEKTPQATMEQKPLAPGTKEGNKLGSKWAKISAIKQLKAKNPKVDWDKALAHKNDDQINKGEKKWYHGTSENVSGGFKPFTYFTSNPDHASDYSRSKTTKGKGSQVHQVEIETKNPHVTSSFMEIAHPPKGHFEKLKAKGHDAIHYKDPKGDVIVPFNSHQIKRSFNKSSPGRTEFIPNTGMKRDSSKPFVGGKSPNVKEKLEKLKDGIAKWQSQ